MKKGLLILVCLFCLVLCLVSVGETVTRSATIVVDVSSNPVTGDTAEYTCSISSDYKKSFIPRITISNSDIAVAQTVTFYDNCGSTDTFTKLWEIDFDAAGGTTDTIQPTLEWFYDSVPLMAEYGLVVTKTLPGSDITVSIQWGNW